jgi:hypothetical protein
LKQQTMRRSAERFGGSAIASVRGASLSKRRRPTDPTVNAEGAKSLEI